MSRTKKDRNKQWRVIKNSLLKKHLHCYSEDIIHRHKDRTVSKQLRNKLKRESIKEMNEMIGGKDDTE